MYKSYYIEKKHILIIILITFVLSSIFLSYVRRVDRSETLRIFITTEYLDQDHFKDTLLEYLKNDGIKEIELSVISSHDPYFSQALLTTGLFEADLLILDASILSSFDLDGSFAKLNGFDDIRNIESGHLFIQEDVIYGAKLTEKPINKYHWIINEANFIFINEASPHETDLLFRVMFFINS